MSKKALLLIDLQNDFCPGGALAVNKGDEIIDRINEITDKKKHPFFDKIVATKDWHPSDHCSFATTFNKKPYEEHIYKNRKSVLWPDHCIQGTNGAEFKSTLSVKYFDMILHKGTMKDIDSYSAFIENDHKTYTGLHGYFTSLRIQNLYIAGLAFDYCVYYTALDALHLGYTVTVLQDLTRSVNVPEGNERKAYDDMIKQGIVVSDSSVLFSK